MKKILQFLFPKIIEELQDEALEKEREREDARNLEYAKQGFSFYIYEKGIEEKGLQHLYKFTPTDLGLVTLVQKKPKAISNLWKFKK